MKKLDSIYKSLSYNHLILLLTLSVLSLSTVYKIPAADTWLNLATGRYIIEQFSIPSKDVFSYTAYGLPWNSTQWLILGIFYMFYLILGIKGLYLLKTILLLGTFIFIFRTSIIRGSNIILSGIFLIISVYMAQPYYYFDMRAYLISYLFISIYIFLLEKRKKENKDFPLWILPLINSIWVNSHSAFLAGFIIIFAYFLDDLINKERRSSSIFLIKTGILTFLSSFLNPYTYKILIYPFTLGQGYGFWQTFLVEWNKPDLFNKNITFTILWAFCFLCIVITCKKISVSDFIIWIFFTYLSFKAVRHITLFCLIITPIGVKHFEILLKKFLALPEADKLFNKIHIKIHAIIITILLFSVTIINIYTVDLSLEKEMFPSYGTEFIKENNIPGKLYNPYEWGGYLMWRLYPFKQVFCDGRADVLYPEDICKKSYFTSKGEDLSVFNEYNINLILCNKINEPYGMNLPSVLQQMPDKWCLIYSDENTYLFIKNDMANKNIINSFYNGNIILPDTAEGNYYEATVLLQKGDYSKALRFLNKSAELNNKSPETFMAIGYIMAVTGKTEEGRSAFLKVIEINSSFPGAHYNLGLIYKKTGLIEEAKKEFKKEAGKNYYEGAQKELDILEKR